MVVTVTRSSKNQMPSWTSFNQQVSSINAEQVSVGYLRKIAIFSWPVSRECYRRSLAVSSTTISYSVDVVILGGCLRFKPHWMFQIYKYVIKGHEELTSCSSVMHSYLFPLLPNFVMAASNHKVAAIQGARNTITSVWDTELIHIYLIYHTNGNNKLCCEPAVKRYLIGRSLDAWHSRYLAI